MTNNAQFEDLFKASPILPILLKYQKSLIDKEIELFKEYVLDSRSNIETRGEKFNKWIKEEIKKYPASEEDIMEVYEKDYYKHNNFYPTVFNSSTLITLYSFFESNFTSLCNTLNKYNFIPANFDVFTGKNYILNCKNYLDSSKKLNISSLDDIYNQITPYQSIRNKIVHHNSKIPKGNVNLIKMVKENQYLEYIDFNSTFIITNDEYLIRFCELINDYLFGIIKKIES